MLSSAGDHPGRQQPLITGSELLPVSPLLSAGNKHLSMNWLPVTQSEQIKDIINKSYEVPCLVFKHSYRCSISSIAQHRLEREWSESDDSVEPYFLDLITHREVSDLIARTFGVRHESPQVILVWKGEPVHHASHLDISFHEIREILSRSA